ncbi:MAG: response regulator [Gemmatimonadetes bacterium]|nr:response regulator [Gemmatimonadota bacterium]
MAPAGNSVLWVDDEADLLESHRLFLTDKGYRVQMARNAADALELLRQHAYDILLLDEQMPGMRGIAMVREARELSPSMPIVMVTKSEEDSTLREALGQDVTDYLVKPVTPRQVLAILTRILEGPRIRSQALARRFVERFRDLEAVRLRDLDWRGWTEHYAEIVQWDVDLAGAGEAGLHASLSALYPAMHRDFAAFMSEGYPRWIHALDGDRPPLSVDVVGEFLLPLLADRRAAVLIVVDCLRLDQWKVLEPIVAQAFDIDTAHYFSLLPTATPYARNALFSGLFPAEIAERFPAWWGERDDESLNQHERDLLVEQLRALRGETPVRYRKLTSAADSDDLERHLASALAADGVSAFVFNFVDMLTHSRSESAILYEVARDETAFRQLTEQWFRRSALWSVLREAARRGLPVLLTSDHGSIHCNTPATVFAKKDATASLRFKMGEDLRPERPEQAVVFTDATQLRLPPMAPRVHTVLATGDCFFVYPTKLREYQQRYRGAFLHGGISPEEVILPLALLTPRR